MLACPLSLDRVLWPPIDSEAPTTLAPAIGLPLESTITRSELEQPARSNADAMANRGSLMEHDIFMDNGAHQPPRGSGVQHETKTSNNLKVLATLRCKA